MSHETKKGHDRSFDVTMGSYNVAEPCDLIGAHIKYLPEKTLQRVQMGLNRDMDLKRFPDQTEGQNTSLIVWKLIVWT